MNSTYTYTFGNRAENHVGMQMIGTEAENGFSFDDLSFFKSKLDEIGVNSRLHSLSEGNEYPDAHVLVCKNALGKLIDKGQFETEQQSLVKIWDTKYYDSRRKAVLNKRARYNLCFNDIAQQPDYINKKGTIVSYKEFPSLLSVKNRLEELLGDQVKGLVVEGNYYYNVNKCYIGYHGDSERKKVIGLRLGSEFPLHFQWYNGKSPVGKRMQINLTDGDIYFMSEYATGYNWKKRNITHLRHAAGTHKLIGLSDDYTLLE